MLAEIMKRLRGGGAETAATLREALEKAEAAVSPAEQALAAAQAERAALLLGGTDRQVLDAEAKVDSARIGLDRLRAAAGELRTRLAAAEKRESEAELDRVLAEAEHSASMAAAMLRARYEPLAAELASVLEKAEEADAKVSAARLAAMKAGREVAVRDVTERLTPEGRIFVPFRDSVSLRPAGRFGGWGLAAYDFQRLGLTAELNPSNRKGE